MAGGSAGRSNTSLWKSGRLKWLGLKGHCISWTRADIDGDGQLDQMRWMEHQRYKRLKRMGIAQETEVQVWLSKSGQTISFKVLMWVILVAPPLVCDTYRDGKAEIGALVPDQHKLIQRLTCWCYDETKRCCRRKTLSQ